MQNSVTEMLPCGITRGNNNIISLLLSRFPAKGDFNFNTIYNDIGQSEFNKAHGYLGSWASQVTGGADRCFEFFKGEGFMESDSHLHKCRLTENGLLLKAKGDYEKYVDFILSEKNKIDQLQREVRQLARRQSIFAEMQVWINLCIAYGVSIAAVYYCVQMYDGSPKPHPCLAKNIFYISIAVGILMLVIRLLRKDKSENS